MILVCSSAVPVCLKTAIFQLATVQGELKNVVRPGKRRVENCGQILFPRRSQKSRPGQQQKQ